MVKQAQKLDQIVEVSQNALKTWDMSTNDHKMTSTLTFREK